MTGSITDIAGRLRSLLPIGWFASEAPQLSGVLSGIAAAHAAIYTLIQFVIAQSRLFTATGTYLDLACTDYFGSFLVRRIGEPDASLRIRARQEILRPRATRLAMVTALTELTGRAPVIFEPARPCDSGGYRSGGVGYCVAGGWGNLSLENQMFLTVYRPHGGGIPTLAGYGSGGILAYGSAAMVQTAVSDTAILQAIPLLLPAGRVAWTRITD